ncbi:hypothetical protein LZ30DRAFT_117195 [Colletotrichum cereale]|nr:hypothetical protein LZ30DRAFT_117195 [Colletotrichum cereale]
MWLKLRRKLSPSVTSLSTSLVFAQPAWGKLHKLHQASAPSACRLTDDYVRSSDLKSLPISPHGIRKHGREEMEGKKKGNLKPIFLSMRAKSSLAGIAIAFAATHQLFRPNFRFDAKKPSRVVPERGEGGADTGVAGAGNSQQLPIWRPGNEAVLGTKTSDLPD